MAEPALIIPEEDLPEEVGVDPEELAQMLSEQHRQAIGGADYSEVSQQRAEGMNRYMGEPYSGSLAPVEGRSQVNSRDLTDAVEWAKPQLIDVFFGGDQVVELDPQSGEDVEAVRLQSQYLNYVYLRENNGFLEGHQAIQDALIQKDGWQKGWVEESVDSELLEPMYGLTDAELEAMLLDPDVEMVGHTIYEDEVEVPGQGFMPVQLHDVELRRFTRERKLKVKAIPPEEIKTSSDARHNLQEISYISHDEEYTQSDLAKLLITLGREDLDAEDLMKMASEGPTTLSSSPERVARHRADSSQPQEPFMTNKVVVHEEYSYADLDGDGFDERIKTFRVGREVIFAEAVNLVPFAHFSVILLSHKLNGLSLHDLIKEIAEIKTSLVRNHLDNFYQHNNSRWAVLDGQVNLEDLLVSRPGGVVRENVAGAVRPLQAPALPNAAFEMLAYYDQLRDERTGISKLSQGLDQNALTSNVASTAISQVMTAAQQRMKLMARVLGEGFKQIFWVLHELSRLYIPGEQRFVLDGQPMAVDPSRFLKRSDLSIRVGLGTAERDSKLQRLGMIAQDMQMIAAQGGAGRILQEQNVYELAVARAKTVGEKNPERFYTDPQLLPPPEQGPSEAEIKLQLAQIDAEKDIHIAKLEIESRERIKAAELERKDDELVLKEREIEAEIEIEKTQKRGAEIG